MHAHTLPPSVASTRDRCVDNVGRCVETLVGRRTFSSKPDFPPVLGIVEKKVDPKTECKCGGYEGLKHAHHP